MSGFLRQATASQARALGPFVSDSDFITPAAGLTIANTDIQLVINGTGPTDKHAGGGTHKVNGVYGVTWDATDTATVGELEVSCKVAGAQIVFDKYWVLEPVVYDALFADAAPGFLPYVALTGSGRVDASVGAYQTGVAPLQPTVALRTLDVTATGAAGIDWANVEAPTTTLNLSGTSTLALEPTTAARKLDVTATGAAGIDWANVENQATAVTLSGTSTKSVQPTVAGRTLDVTATGAAGIDWGNVENQATAVTLSGTSTKALEPTVAARTLDVTATGAAAIDWGSIENPTTVQNLSGTTVKTATDIATQITTVSGQLPAALVGGRMDSSLGAYQASLNPAFKRNTAHPNFVFNLTSTDAQGVTTPKTGLGGAFTVNLSIDGAAFASVGANKAEISLGFYKCDLAQANTNGVQLVFDISGAGSDHRQFAVITEP